MLLLVLLLLQQALWTVTAGGASEDCPKELKNPCFDRYLSAAVDLAVKLALANDGQCHVR